MPNRGKIELRIEVDNKGGIKVIRATGRELEKFAKDGGKSVKELNSTLGALDGRLRGIDFAKLGVGAAAMAAAVGTAMVKAVGHASDFNETVSKANTIFGDASADIMKWSEDAATAMGLSRRAALENAATLGNMYKQLGAGTDIAADNSKQMVQLAADIASFHNVAGGAEEVLVGMQAAFRGEYDALQRYIPTINAAAVEHEALAMTGKKTGKELTALEKALAAQKIIMRDAGDAVGDFARTADGLANKQRIAAAKTDDLWKALGKHLIPIAEDLVGSYATVIEKTTKWIEKNEALLKTFTDLAGGRWMQNWFATDAVDAEIRKQDELREKIRKLKKELENPDWWLNFLKGPDYADKAREKLAKLNLQLANSRKTVQALEADLKKTGGTAGVDKEPEPAPGPSAADPVKTDDKWLSQYLADVKQAEDAEQERSEQIGVLAAMEAGWRTEAVNKARRAEEEWLSQYLADVKQAEDAERERSEQIGVLAAMEAGWRTEARKKDIQAANDAYQRMYQDLGARRDGYYADQLAALEKERQEYERLTGDKALVDQWYLDRKKQIIDEMTLAEGDFIDKVRLGIQDLAREQIDWAETGKTAVENMADKAGGAVKTMLIDAIHGDMKDFKTYWDRVWGDLLDTVVDTLEKMAEKWVASQVLDFFDFDLEHEGKWLQDDEGLVVRQKGEMVIPKDLADDIREHYGSFAEMEADFAAASAGAGLSADGQAVLEAMAKYYGEKTVRALPYVLSGQATVGDLLGYLAGPSAAVGAGVTGLNTLVSDMYGFDYQKLELPASLFGHTMSLNTGATAGKVLGALALGAPGAVIGAVLGPVALDGLLDALDMRPDEYFRDKYEDMFGYAGGRAYYAAVDQAKAALDPYGVDEIAAAFGWDGPDISDIDLGVPDFTADLSAYGGTADYDLGYDFDAGYESAWEDDSDWGEGYRRGGWTTGPDTGHWELLHGNELVLNEDQVRAVRELAVGGGRSQPLTIIVEIGGQEFYSEFVDLARREADTIRIRASQRTRMATRPIYNTRSEWA